MTDSNLQKQFDNEQVEAETAAAKPKRKWAKFAISGFTTCALVAGAYYAYGLLFPDPWYIRALAIFGF